MKKRFMSGVLALLLTLMLPTESVFAQEAGEDSPESISQMAEQGEQSERQVETTPEQQDVEKEDETDKGLSSEEDIRHKTVRTIEVESEFFLTRGEKLPLNAKLKADGNIVEGELRYASADESIARVVTDAEAAESGETVESGEALEADEVYVEAVGVGETTLTITAPAAEEYEEVSATVTICVTEPVQLAEGKFESAENKAGGIVLRWKSVEGASGYRLYRSADGKVSWNLIKETKKPEEITYTDAKVTAGKTYYYKVKAVDALGAECEKDGEKRKMVRLLAPTLCVSLASTGNQLHWNRPEGAGGYYVYRKESSQSQWTKVAALGEPGEISWRDTSAVNGKAYDYTVKVYKSSYESDYAVARSYVRVSAPSVKSWKRASSTKYKLVWKTNSVASGYQIQYAQNAMFAGAKKVTVKSGKTASRTISGLEKKKNYFARIRAYKTVGGKTYYSAWSASSNTKTGRTTKVSVLSKKKKTFEIRAWAKQKMYQYDTLQGSCTDGTYAYYLLNNRKNSRCKIVKVKRSTLKVTKVSGALDVGHGNDMTYDSVKKQLVIVHSTGKDPKALTSVNPSTLAVTASKHITIPKKLAGGSETDAKNATSFTGLAYSSGRRQYVVLLSHNYNFVILDGNMNPVQYVKVSKKDNYTMQGIDATDDYILVAQSPKTSKQKYNIITIYDWDGNYISKINVKKGYEIESIYHVGSKFYAGFYRSYYKTYYKKVVKKVKVKGKVKKKKVKVKYRKYLRDNYVYQITGI